MPDFRFAFRQLLKNPGFTIAAVLTLALGIGANTAIFSVVNALLFRPLAFREPERLVWIANTDGDGLSGVTTRVANFQEWRSRNNSFEDLAAYFAFFDYGSYTLTGAGEPERLRGVGVTQNLLKVLGIQPQLGRGFDDEECKWNGRKAALLSHSFWQRRFASDSSIVGRTMTLNDQPTVIVGVLPASFDFASTFSPGSKAEIVVPFSISAETDRWGNTLAVIGRLKPGVTLGQAQAELDVLNSQIKTAFPDRGTGFGAILSGLPEQVTGRFRRSFLVLFGAVGCVLLIACTNLSNLLLARASARRKEFGIRVAMGARRGQLVRQMLTESILLAVCGAALGLPLAITATNVLAASRAFDIPLLSTIGVDTTALIFTSATACLTGLLFGLAPALQLSTSNLRETLNEATRGSTAHRHGLRDWLVIAEIGLACVLLVGAGLFIRSFVRLLDVDLGFAPDNAVAWRIETSRQFPSGEERVAFYDELTRQVREIPGVESAGLTDTLPLGRNRSWTVGAKGETYLPGQTPGAFPRIVSPSYTQTMHIPLRAGRELDSRDTSQTERVMLINETMARLLWPGREAVNGIVLIGRNEIRVVGIVGNVRHGALEEVAGPEMYLPMAQSGDSAMELVVRSRLPMAVMVPGVRAVLHRIDPNLPDTDFQTLGQIVDHAASARRLVTLLLGGFSLAALVLAALGIYGVIAYSVSQRTREIGVRMALGAERRRVLGMIVGEGMRRAMLGVAVGLVASLVLTRAVRSLLFGISATDPLTFGGIALLLSSVALLAAYLPARRAANVDPMEALRSE